MTLKQSAKIAIFGNHSCSNRGDCAIARGLITWIRQYNPSAEITLYTRYPEAAKLFLDVNVLSDPLYVYYNKRSGKLSLLWKLLIKRFMAVYLASGFSKYFGLPSVYKEFKRDLAACDLFVQVGGSFFVDVYGITQYEGVLLACSAGVPVVACGHSVGPFRGRKYKHVARRAFKLIPNWLLREDVSFEIMKSAELPVTNIKMSGDTAWLISGEAPVPNNNVKDFSKTVAITVRELAPFDKTLNLSQEEYEAGIARLSDELINLGYSVYFVSTCTGLDSYWRDDRMVAHRIKRLVSNSDGVYVIMDEWSDLELAAFMGECRFVIATRLHSAILAMRYGTPTITLGYEHKSAGILKRMGLEELDVPLTGKFDHNAILRLVEQLIVEESKYRNKIRVAVAREIDHIDAIQAEVFSEVLNQYGNAQ